MSTKPMSMDREMLLAYQQRWQMVREKEDSEQLAATVAERWQQLNALFRLAGSLGLQSMTDKPLIDPARQRWNQLKSLYLAGKQEAQS